MNRSKTIRNNTQTIKAIEDTEKGIGLSKGYIDLNEMWRDLEKNDWLREKVEIAKF